jgi:hypothetical protein
MAAVVHVDILLKDARGRGCARGAFFVVLLEVIWKTYARRERTVA